MSILFPLHIIRTLLFNLTLRNFEGIPFLSFIRSFFS